MNNAKIAIVIVIVPVITDDCFMSDEKLEGTQGGHSSFLHNSHYSSPQWQRELLLSNNNNSNSSGVRLTSVSHRREDSDDIRSDTSSDNLVEDNEDSDDTSNSGLKTQHTSLGAN